MLTCSHAFFPITDKRSWAQPGRPLFDQRPLSQRLGVAAILRVLTHSHASSLTSLNLCDRQLGDEGAAAVARACEGLSSLSRLLLSRCGMRAIGAQQVGELLACHTSITALHLEGNSLAREGARCLLGALHRGCKLRLLDLRDTELACGGAGAVASFLCSRGGSNLSSLNLSNNQIGPEGGRALAGALAANASLVSLSVEGNQISSEGLLLLGSALQRNRTGQLQYLACDAFSLLEPTTSLDLSNCCLGLPATTALVAALSRNTRLRKLSLARR
ncbi:MAG: hypothetical protein SGPRY_013680 [Prymnesium sp.]